MGMYGVWDVCVYGVCGVWMYGPGRGGVTRRVGCMAVCELSYSVPHTATHTSISGTARLTGGMDDMKVKAKA